MLGGAGWERGVGGGCLFIGVTERSGSFGDAQKGRQEGDYDDLTCRESEVKRKKQLLLVNGDRNSANYARKMAVTDIYENASRRQRSRRKPRYIRL